MRLIILLVVIAAISFIMIQMSPIDPVRAYLGQRIVSQEQLAIMGEYWGTNLSLGERVMGWLSTLASDPGLFMLTQNYCFCALFFPSSMREPKHTPNAQIPAQIRKRALLTVK